MSEEAWIDVWVRPPDQDIFLAIKDKHYMILRKVNWWGKVAYSTESGHRVRSAYDFTHWMPLPPLPNSLG